MDNPASRRPPEALGPPRLRIVQDDFLKPTTRANEVSVTGQRETLPADRFQRDDWE